MLLIAAIGASLGLLLGLVIGFRAGFLALRVAARVITLNAPPPYEPTPTSHSPPDGRETWSELAIDRQPLQRHNVAVRAVRSAR
jgi:predicted MFS family arabinose efflux permease